MYYCIQHMYNQAHRKLYHLWYLVYTQLHYAKQNVAGQYIQIKSSCNQPVMTKFTFMNLYNTQQLLLSTFDCLYWLADINKKHSCL